MENGESCPMHWYVQVQGQSYGPYTEEQMAAFAAEGRINEHSLIANDLQSGYFPAVGFEQYSSWSRGPVLAHAVNSSQNHQSSYDYSRPTQATQTETEFSPRSLIAEVASTPSDTIASARSFTRIFLIMSEINSEGSMAFLRALQELGAAERIGETVWLLKSSSTVEQLRNKLSQTLNRQDRLFILDSQDNKPAWFNIGADLDHRIRELWEDDEN